MSKEIFLKIAVIGDTQTGKTSLIKRFVTGCFQSTTHYKPTVGDDVHTRSTLRYRDIDTGVDALLQIWDISAKTSFAGASACVIVYDINDDKSFKNVEKWRAKFFENINVNEYVKRNIPLLLLANKCDLNENNHIRKAQLLTSECCKSIEKQWNIFIPTDIANIIFDNLTYLMSTTFDHGSKYKDMLFYKVSALNGTNIEQSFKAIVTRCIERNFFAPSA